MIRIGSTDHLPPLHDLSDTGRSALANVLGSWFVSHDELDRVTFLDLISESAAVCERPTAESDASECGACDCDFWHSEHRWHCATNYPEGGAR